MKQFQAYATGPVAFLLTAALAACTDNSTDSSAANSDPISHFDITVPAGDDSMGPKLSQGPDGLTVLSWIERGEDQDSLRFSRWMDNAWSAPITVASGDNWFVNWADFPSVVPVSATLWGAHWLARRPAGGYAYDAYSSISVDGGATWSNGSTLHRDGTDTEHGFVTLYPQVSGVGAIWLDGRKMINDVEADPTSSGMTLRAATVTIEKEIVEEQVVDELVCDCCQTDVAVTSSGPVAVYRNRSVDEIRDIYVSRFEDGRWQPGTSISDDDWTIHGCPVNGPTIVAKDERVAVAWFTSIDDVPHVRLSLSDDAGRTFGEPVNVVSGDTLGRVAAALIDDGAIAVAWLSVLPDGTNRLSVTSVAQDGALGGARTLTEGVASFSFPHMVVVDDQLLVAWTDAGDERSRVGSALVPLDELLRRPGSQP